MDIVKQFNDGYQPLKQALETEIANLDGDLSRGALTRARNELRNQPEFSRLKWKQRPINESELDECQYWLAGLVIPSALIEFATWSGAFFNPQGGDNEAKKGQFSSSLLQLKFPTGQDLYSHQLEIAHHQRKPLEFRRVIIVGKYDRHDIGVFISPTDPAGGEVILFDPRTRVGANIKDEFTVIASHIELFLARIAHGFCQDIAINLIQPVHKDAAWLEQYESQQVRRAPRYSFKEVMAFKQSWRVQDLNQELAYIATAALTRFGGERNLKAEQQIVKGMIKKYGL